jgi:hypothetical protein
MKTKRALFYCLVALLAGCGPVFSLHPLFTKENLVFDEKLLGTWVDDPNESDNTWQFARLDEAAAGNLADEFREDFGKFYRLNVTSKRNNEVHRGSLVACLVKLEDRMFLDVFPDQFPSGEQDVEKLPLLYNAFFFVPVHTFLTMEFAGDQLKLRLTDDEKFAKLLEAEPGAVKHETLDDRPILTASTKELQAFVLQHVGDERLFADEVILTRKSK